MHQTIYALSAGGGGTKGILSSSNAFASYAARASSASTLSPSTPGRSHDHGSSYDQPGGTITSAPNCGVAALAPALAPCPNPPNALVDAGLPKALPPKAEVEPNALVLAGVVPAGLAPKGLDAGVEGAPKALVAGGVDPNALVVGAAVVVPKALVAGAEGDGAVAVALGEAALAGVAVVVVPKAEPPPNAEVVAAGFPKALWPNADCG